MYGSVSSFDWVLGLTSRSHLQIKVMMNGIAGSTTCLIGAHVKPQCPSNPSGGTSPTYNPIVCGFCFPPFNTVTVFLYIGYIVSSHSGNIHGMATHCGLQQIVRRIEQTLASEEEVAGPPD